MPGLCEAPILRSGQALLMSQHHSDHNEGAGTRTSKHWAFLRAPTRPNWQILSPPNPNRTSFIQMEAAEIRGDGGLVIERWVAGQPGKDPTSFLDAAQGTWGDIHSISLLSTESSRGGKQQGGGWRVGEGNIWNPEPILPWDFITLLSQGHAGLSFQEYLLFPLALDPQNLLFLQEALSRRGTQIKLAVLWFPL